MIIYFFKFNVSISHLTMPSRQNGAKSLKRMVARSSQGVSTGIEVNRCQMNYQQNLMKMLLVWYGTILTTQFIPKLIQFLHIVILTLIPSQKYSTFLGKAQNPSPSVTQYPTWALTGTSQLTLFQSWKARRQNTKQQSRNGYRNWFTPWMKYKDSMESSFTYLSSYQPGMPTSQAWRACWGHSLQILLCHITPLETRLKTSPGGSTSSITTKSLSQSLVHAALQTGVHSQMWAQALASSLLEGGVLGNLSLDGNEMGGTSDGQKLLALSFLSTLSSQPENQGNISKSSATIVEWLKAGGKGEAETEQLIMYSGESTTSQLLKNAFLLHATSPAKRTQPMDLHRAYMLLHPCYYQPFKSLRVSNDSSSTMIANLFPVSVILQLTETLQKPSQSPNKSNNSIKTQITNHSTSTNLIGSKSRSPSNWMRPNKICSQNPPTIPQNEACCIQPAFNPHPFNPVSSLPCTRLTLFMECWNLVTDSNSFGTINKS